MCLCGPALGVQVLATGSCRLFVVSCRSLISAYGPRSGRLGLMRPLRTLAQQWQDADTTNRQVHACKPHITAQC